MRTPNPEFWAGRRVLVTGHTGFKGAWLSAWLRDMGAHVVGVALPEPVSEPALWDQLALDDVLDIREDVSSTAWHAAVRDADPSIVFHLAAQPLVSVGYRDPGETFRTNVLGTVRVMELVESLPAVEATVVITTDKVYDPRQRPPHPETAMYGGHDPYSASKAAAELVVHSWPSRERVVTARAGNVIGGGDWALDRLLPDLVRAWGRGEEVVLRMPDAVRPWQHVIEPLCGYLVYAETVALGDEHVPAALNFGPDRGQQVSVAEVVSFAAAEWSGMAEGPAPRWRVVPRPDMGETGVLTLDSSLASRALGWNGQWTWQEAVSRTLGWHAGAASGASAHDRVARDLRGYVERAAQRDRE